MDNTEAQPAQLRRGPSERAERRAEAAGFLEKLAEIQARLDEAEELLMERNRLIYNALQPDVKLTTGDAIAEVIHSHHSWPHRIRDEYPAKLAAHRAELAKRSERGGRRTTT